MFTNLIESNSHRTEYRRRGSFFLITVAAYAVVLFAAGIVSVYAYDAQLEAQTSSLELLNWVPPVTREQVRPRETEPQRIRRSTPSNARVDPNITISERTVAQAPATDPRLVPDQVGVVASNIPPVTGPVRITERNVDPPNVFVDNSRDCVGCSGPGTVVQIEDNAPEPKPVKPKTERVPSTVLISKVISLPQPPYPAMARQIRVQGVVGVQILVDEQGRVISAQPVSGHPLLVGAAKDAAMRARFTPTVLNGQPVKIQGVITYNFVMQ